MASLTHPARWVGARAEELDVTSMDLIRNDVKNKNGGDGWGTLYGTWKAYGEVGVSL